MEKLVWFVGNALLVLDKIKVVIAVDHTVGTNLFGSSANNRMVVETLQDDVGTVIGSCGGNRFLVNQRKLGIIDFETVVQKFHLGYLF